VSDTIDIQFYPSSVISLGNDTSICGYSPLFITPGTGYSAYSWNNGVSNNDSLFVDTSGVYFVNVIDSNGCQSSDTISVVFHDLPSPVLTSGDTTLCEGETLTVSAIGQFVSYLWNNGLNSSSISINQTGYYFVQVQDMNGCYGYSDSLLVIFTPLPGVYIGNDTSIAVTQELLLNAGSGFQGYLWNGNPLLTDSLYLFKGDSAGLGLHKVDVVVSDSAGCTNSDTISIEVYNNVVVPDAFQNGKMEVFPNPAKQNINVRLPETSCANWKVRVIDMTGKDCNVSSVLGPDKTIRVHISSLNAGNYLISLYCDNYLYSILKICIQ